MEGRAGSGARPLFEELPDSLLLLSQASRTVKVIHAHSLKLGVASKGLLGNTIVDLYSKCGNIGFAQKAFDQLEKKDVFAWNSILSVFSKWGLLDRVLGSFVSLWSYRVASPNEFTFAMVLSSCARLVDVEFGRQVHCGAVKMGFELDSYCQGALVDMYAKCNHLSDARKVFGGNGKMDIVAWTAMITGYVQDGLPEEVLKVFEELDYACELFAEMPSPNVVAWNVMISGHAKAGYVEEAIIFFVRMMRSGVKPTRSTLGSILSAVASVGAFDYGSLIHAYAVKQGLDSNFYVGSSLINMYAKCQKMDASKKVFDAVDIKNVVLWNAMLGGYAQNRFASEVIELFCNMKGCGVQTDEFTYTSILSACTCLEFLEFGCQLHLVIIKKKFASNLFVGNALTDMYAKSGALKDARKQFERMSNRDKVSWSAIIVGYVHEGDVAEAFNIFRRMISHGFMPDEVSFASILSAFANVIALEQGQQFHCLSIKSGLETSLYSGSSLIDMYAKCGAIEGAHKVFSLMPQRGVVSMNVLIAGYCQINLEKAVSLLRDMQATGLSPTDITCASLLDVCNGSTGLILGRQIHCLVQKRALLFGDYDFLRVALLSMYMNSRHKVDAEMLFSEFPQRKSTVLWTAMISGLTQNDFSEEALELYQKMHSQNVLPDQATFASILRACAVMSSLLDGKETHSLIIHTGFNLDELTCCALVDMYAKCGDVLSSAQVFREMRTKNDAISWNSMIVGFAKNGYAADALQIFEEMRQAHITPDDVAFLGVLTACSHTGKVAEGRKIFNCMINDYGVEPRVDHVGCMVDLLGRWGFLKEAEELFYKLSFDSDAMIWATLLGACRLHGDDSRGRRVAKKLIDLDPQNSSPYVLLSNICAASGNWSEVNSLRMSMKEKGVAKLPGCSWIVEGQKTHLFVAGDKSHPNAGEIHRILEYLTGLMNEDTYVMDMDSFLPDVERREGNH
ncbi:hypothetical protein TIFTF001_042580, partial [Ficus carica]